MTQRTRCGRMVVGSLIGGCVSALVFGLSAGAALANGPIVTLTNNADGSGTFAQTENLAKTATFPDMVTFSLTVDGSAAPGSPLLRSVSDTAGADLTGCNALDGTPIKPPLTCTFTLALTGPMSQPLTDTVTVVYAGGDVRQANSTIEFPALTVAKSSTTTFVGAIGQVVPYSYTVTNTGTTALTGVSLSDNNTDSAPSCPAMTLALGASM